MAGLPEFPLSRSQLERYRIAASHRAPASQVGAHLLRRKGQSVEFHDFAQYSPGDDFRHIDWQASARYGRKHDLLVRQFRAEENLNLVISIDNRLTMHYPEAAQKAEVGCWLAFAVCMIAVGGGDRVHLHQLFADNPRPPLSLRGAHAESSLWAFLEGLASEQASEDIEPDLRGISRLLPPASVWLVISDLYFAHQEALARAMARAQRGLCWVILVDLDSWACEREILGHGPRRVLGPTVTDDAALRVDVSTANLRAVEETIAAAKTSFLEPVPRSGFSYLHWRWPAERKPDAAALFEHAFTSDNDLQRLFRRQR